MQLAICVFIFLAATFSCGFEYSNAINSTESSSHPLLIPDKIQSLKSNSVSKATKSAESRSTMDDTKTTPLVHKLLNVPINNGTGTVFLNINLHKIMEDPYVHGIVLPAAVGVIMALLTLLLVCSIRSCVRSSARKRRRRRIRELANELKADQKVLMTTADSSDDEV